MNAPPRAAILGVPIVMGTAVMVGGLAWIVAIQFTSGKATGGRVHASVTATCEAVPTLVARLDDLGLEPKVSGDGIDFVLPGLADDRTHMPGVLTAIGRLSVDGADVVPNHAGVQLSLQGGAVTILTLDHAVTANPVVTIDGVTAQVVQANGGELQLAADASNSSDALRLATDHAIALRHPLPCPVTLGPLGDVL